MKALRRIATLALIALLLVGWQERICKSANLQTANRQYAIRNIAEHQARLTQHRAVSSSLDAVRTTPLFSITHTTQADWMSGERDHLALRH